MPKRPLPDSAKDADYPRCGKPTAENRPCRNKAGKGTHHVGTGACRKHGGTSGGAPVGNKNAVVTGAYESLHDSALTDEERRFYNEMNISPLEQAAKNVRLYSLREQRILLRIRAAIEQADESGFEVVRETAHKGWNVKGKVDFTVQERESVLNTVQRLDDALNKVQSSKQKAIEHYRSILMDDPPDHDYLGSLASAIDRSAVSLGIVPR